MSLNKNVKNSLKGLFHQPVIRINHAKIHCCLGSDIESRAHYPGGIALENELGFHSEHA